MRNKIYPIALIAAACAIVFAACGGPKTPTPEPTRRPVMSFDFEDVCREGSVARAAAYEPEPGSGDVHPVIVFRKDTEGSNSYHEIYPSTLEFPASWMVDTGGDYGVIEIVTCVERVEEEFVRTCDYEDDEDDEVYKLDIYNATYEVNVYTAQSGEALGNTTMNAIDEECPMMYFFSEGESKEDYFAPVPPADLQAYLEQFVKP